MHKTIVFCVVGHQNSGKTRFVLSILHKLDSLGLSVAVLKHDGHAEQSQANDWEKSQSDTNLALTAGASMTMVAGGGESLLHVKGDPVATNVYRLCDRLKNFYREQHGRFLDVIVVEGFKNSQFPKIVMCRTPENIAWLKENPLFDVRAIIVPEDLRETILNDWPVYDESEIERVLKVCDVPFRQ